MVKLIFIVVGVLFVGRLAMLQLFSSKYRDLAKQQSLRPVTQYPARGFIYDRHGELLVHNEAVYDLMVIPRMVKGLDTNYFCESLGITRDDFDERIRKARKYSTYSASIFTYKPAQVALRLATRMVHDHHFFECDMFKLHKFRHSTAYSTDIRN